MDMNRMTQKVREALAAAQTLAGRLNHQEIDAEHLLAELLAQEGGLASRLLEQAGGKLAAIRKVFRRRWPGARR